MAAPLETTRTRLPGLSGTLSAACSQNSPALTSVSQVAVKSAQLIWSSRPIRGFAPAFSAKMSGRTSARMRWAALSSVTSAEIVATPSRARTEASASMSRATTVTLAPCATSASTSPMPRPRLPPVTTTFLSLRLMSSAPLFRYSQNDRGSKKESINARLVGHRFSPLAGAALFPAIELDLVRRRGSLPGFEQRLQAQQKDRPLGAAMVHEFHRLLPALVLEEDDGPVAFLSEIETNLCADPFLRPVDDLPHHALAGLKLENLHVDPAGAKAELDHAADLAVPLCGGGPPAGKTIEHGQCLVGIILGRRFDSDFV